MRKLLPLARRAVVFELRLYRSLLRWIIRRPDVPDDAAGFSYIGGVIALLWGFIIVSAIEMVVLHVVLPWETIRLAADILSAWGLVWMLGLMASYRVYPHLLTAEGLRIRHGAGPDLSLPWAGIASVAVRERSRDSSRALQVDHQDTGAVLNVVIASRTNVDITLRHPLDVPVRGSMVTVTEVRAYVDDPRRLVTQTRKHSATSR